MSHARERGAFLGLAFVLCVQASADDSLRDRPHRELRHESYILIETPGAAPRLLLLSDGIDIPVADPREGSQSERIDRALVLLADGDPEVRADAVLTLGDLQAPRHLIAAALSDPAPVVREAAAAVLEDLDDAE